MREAIERAAAGLVDADLGGHLIKQRVARPGRGRSGGYRTLIAFRTRDVSVFLYGFAKRERENIDPDELLTLREIGSAWLGADAARIVQALNDEALYEVADGNDKET